MMPVEDMPLPPPPEGRSSLFQALFEFPVSACELRGIGSPQNLLPAERDSIAGAVPARIAEFAAGRHCAHQALQAFGVAGDMQLLRGPRREPLWPAGLVGSITHTAGYCAAVVAPASACAGLGIDASELALLRAQDPLNNGHLATVLFAVKEAFFKSHFRLSGAMPEFTDIALRPTAPWAEQGTVELIRVGDARVAAWARHASLRYALHGPLVLASATLPHDRP